MHMNLTLETRVKLEELCCQLGMSFEECPCGVVVENGVERFLLKFAKGKRIIKIYHENFERSGKRMPLQYSYSELTNKMLQTYYHVQNFAGTDLKQVVMYIFNHGKNRRLMDQKRNIILQKKCC